MKKFPFVKLDEFVVMPNHIHGIVVINKTEYWDETDCRDATNRVSTADHTADPTIGHNNNPTTPGGITGHKNPMLHDNLSRIIRWYKGRVTYECRKQVQSFAWQSRFYNHIIRNDAVWKRIAEYIRNIQHVGWRINFIHVNEDSISKMKSSYSPTLTLLFPAAAGDIST